ncbi:MAG: hypothetical protein NZM16_11620, partial [Thermoflexus sp.]|uniref:hypothetical protein n=1 Tax=Thermoflexus sp. TaxID=1969742 RepID=UPI0025FDE1BC
MSQIDRSGSWRIWEGSPTVLRCTYRRGRSPKPKQEAEMLMNIRKAPAEEAGDQDRLMALLA